MSSLDQLIRFADKMVSHGTDRYGAVHSPMFASVISAREDGAPGMRTPDLPGQRVGDRSWFGTNLMHDIPLIRAFGYLSDITGRDTYRGAVDSYLDFFCRHCPNDVTGLFPWGEHAYWHHFHDRPTPCGESVYDRSLVHDHLRQAPPWFWEKIAQHDPRIVIRFGEGLLGHLKDEESFEYSRHAAIEKKTRSEGMFHFPRHGGFYIVDWAIAYRYSKAGKFLDWIDGMVRFHAGNVSLANGLLRMDNRPGGWEGLQVSTLHQTVSLCLSIFETIEVLADVRDERKTSWEALATMALAGVEGVLATADPRRVYAHYDFATGQGVDEQRVMPFWQTSYGVVSVTELAVLLLGLFRRTGHRELRDCAIRVFGELEKRNVPPPPDPTRRHDYSASVPAGNFGMALNLALEVWDLTDDEETAARAGNLARRIEAAILEQLFDNDWLLAASGTYWYDSQMDPARVAHALVRLYDIEHGGEYGVEPDYQSR